MNFLKKLFRFITFKYCIIDKSVLSSIKQTADRTYYETKHFNIYLRQGTMTIIHNPTDNCQLFCVKNARLFVNMSEIELKKNIDLIQNFTYKPQMLIDIRKEEYKKIVRILKPYYRLKMKKHYESTNYSEMILCLFSSEY